MSLIAQILAPQRILLGVAATDKAHLFEQIAAHFAAELGLPANVIAASLSEREKLGSTGLGHAVAIPHGRIKGLNSPVAAIAQLDTPIDFGAPDGTPVSLLVALLVPQKATDLHLQILSELAQLLSQKALRERLLRSRDPAEIYSLLSSDKNA